MAMKPKAAKPGQLSDTLHNPTNLAKDADSGHFALSDKRPSNGSVGAQVLQRSRSASAQLSGMTADLPHLGQLAACMRECMQTNESG